MELFRTKATSTFKSIPKHAARIEGGLLPTAERHHRAAKQVACHRLWWQASIGPDVVDSADLD